MKQARRLALAFGTVLLGAASVHAANVSWTNAGAGAWSDTANWAGGTLPTTADVAYIAQNNATVATVDTAGAIANQLYFRRGTLNVPSGGVLNLSNAGTAFYVTDEGWPYTMPTTLNISGGSLISAGSMQFANGYGGGTLNLTNGGYLQTGWFYGYKYATINVDGGTLSATSVYSSLQLGNHNTLAATMDIKAGLVKAERSIDFQRAATITQSGGTLNNRSAGSNFGVNIGSTTGAGQADAVTYTMSGGLIDANGLKVWGGRFGTATFNFNGGTVDVNSFSLMHNNTDPLITGATGTVNMTGGTMLWDGRSRVGDWNSTAVFNQSGGLTKLGWNDRPYGYSQMALGYSGNGTVNWHLTGGEMSVIDRGYIPDAQGNPQSWSNSYIAIGHAATSQATFQLGDATGTGTLSEWGGTLGAVSVFVRNAVGASGTLIGWSDAEDGSGNKFGLRGTLSNSGQVIASGYGQSRTLDFSSMAGVSRNKTLGLIDGQGNAAGWYAVDGGRLILPNVAVGTGTPNVNWGEAPADTGIELVNSARLTLHGVTGAGTLTGALLAPDHGSVPDKPFWLRTDFIGLWDFGTTATGFTGVDLEFRYDDTALAALGLLAADVDVYHYTGGQWVALDAELLAGQKIKATGATGFSMFAVGSLSIIPEPSTLVLLALGLLAVGRRRSSGA